MKASVSARAALAGNPSDMYGGAVLAIPVRSFAAHARVVDGTTSPPSELVDAVRARIGAVDGIEWYSDIPQSVGLAGSSAIVIAALRALGVEGDPLTIAKLALSIERDDVGTPAGLQDRVVQSFDRPVLVVDDAALVLTPARPLSFVVAWSPAAAGHSGQYHRDLVANAADMTGLGDIARAAAQAFKAGDADALASAMDESARLRQRVAPLSAEHEALADAARRAGFRPNSTGSGGAIVAVLEADPVAIGVDYVVEVLS